MDLIIDGKTICGYISDNDYNNNMLNIRCDDIANMGIALAYCYNNKYTYIKHDDNHMERIKINSVKISDKNHVEFSFDSFGIFTKDSILIKVDHSNDIIREHVTEDGHIDLFGTTFSVKRYNSWSEEIEYRLERLVQK